MTRPELKFCYAVVARCLSRGIFSSTPEFDLYGEVTGTTAAYILDFVEAKRDAVKLGRTIPHLGHQEPISPLKYLSGEAPV